MSELYSKNATMRLIGYNCLCCDDGFQQVKDIASAHGKGHDGEALNIAYDGFIAGIIAGKRLERAKRRRQQLGDIQPVLQLYRELIADSDESRVEHTLASLERMASDKSDGVKDYVTMFVRTVKSSRYTSED